MATVKDFVLRQGLVVNTAATINGVDVLANDYATYTTLMNEINALAANVSGNADAALSQAYANDYTTYTTLQSEYQANDFNTYTTLQSEYQANDFTTYTTLQSEYQANDFTTYSILMGEISSSANTAAANDFSTYSTLVNEYQSNDFATYSTLQSAYRANDYATYTTLLNFADIKANSATTITAGDGLTGGGDLSTDRTLAVDSTVVRTSGDQSIAGQKTFTDSVIVEGDLTINGNVTTVSSTNLEVTDRFIQLASNTTGAPAADVGIYLNRGSEGNSAIYYDEAQGYFAFAHTLDPASNSVVAPTSFADLRVNSISVDSTSLVDNLNADLLDSQEGVYYLDALNFSNTSIYTLDYITANGNTTTNSLQLGGLRVGDGVLFVDSANSRVGVNNQIPQSELHLSQSGVHSNELNTISAGVEVDMDSFSASTFRTAKYVVQIHDTVNDYYQSSEILLVHDNTGVYLTEYAIVTTNSVLATFDAAISAGDVKLRITPVSSATTVKFVRSTLNV